MIPSKSNATAITFTWKGGASGHLNDWNTAANWTQSSGSGSVPGSNSTDIVSIGGTSYTYQPTLSTGTVNIASITVGTSTAPTLTLATGATVNVSGTITLNGSATVIGGGTLSAVTVTTGNSSVSLTIGDGSTGITHFNVSGSLSMNNQYCSLANAGLITLSSGATYTANGTNASIANSGEIDVTGATCTWGTANGVYFTNSGSVYLTKSATNVSPTFAITGGWTSTCFVNQGTFSATSATVNFNSSNANGVTNSGTFYASASPLTFGTNQWTFSNTGTFSALSGSNIQMPSNSSTLSSTSGTMTITGSNITMGGNPSSITNSGSSVCTISNSVVSIAQGGVITQSSSGAFTINGGSAVTIGQNCAINNTGIFYAGTSNGTTASTCSITLNGQSAAINNSTASVVGHFYLGPGSIIYMPADQVKINNNANASGVFTLRSDATGSAAIGPVYSTASTSGTFSIQRYYQGGSTQSGGRYIYRNYRIISSAVHNSAQYNSNNVYGLNYIVGTGNAGQTTGLTSYTNAFVTGCTGCNTAAGNPTLYLYRESIVPNSTGFTSGNFIGITNITNSSGTGVISTSDGSTTSSIPVGNGVLFFDRGPATNWATRTKSPYITPDTVTLTSTGLLNTGSITVKDWYNTGSSFLGCTTTGVGTGSNTNTKVRGFNMVGNPYACSIDWNTSYSGTGITRTNVNPTIWVFNPVTNQYDTYITTSASTGTHYAGNGGAAGTGNATNIIASGQGFFVQATSAAASSLVFTENAKLATAQVTGSSLLMGAPVAETVAQQLRLKMITDSINYDDIVIGFRSTASPKFDGMEDARYIPGNGAAEGLSSLSGDSVKLSINYLPLPKLAPQSIKLFVTAAHSGQYTLQKAALDGLPQIYEVWLIDKYKKDSLDIRNNNNYIFNIDLTDTMSYGINRFEVLIRQNPALGVHLLQFAAAKATGGSKVTWKTENEVNYTNFTVERSNDNGVTFNVVGGFVSSDLGSYSFLDATPAIGANQYRLRLEDLNGAITYSKIVTLQYANGTNDITINNITVYPNPASSTINLAIAQVGSQPANSMSALQSLGTSPALNTTQTGSISYGIKIMSITGSVVKNSTSATASWQDNVSSLSPGTYIIQVTNNKDKSVVGKGTFIKL